MQIRDHDFVLIPVPEISMNPFLSANAGASLWGVVAFSEQGILARPLCNE